MRKGSPLTAIVGATFALEVVSCGNGDDSSFTSVSTPVADAGTGAAMHLDATATIDAAATDATADAAVEALPADDAGPPDTSTSTSTSPLAFVRVANWSAGAPSVDFCLAPHGTTAYAGPFFADLSSSDAGSGEAGLVGLSFPEVSAYVLIAPGQYDARLVTAGSSDCSTGIIADATTLPTLPGDGAETIALVGAAHPTGSEPTLAMAGFLDDTATAANVALRVINASPDLPSVDVDVSGKPLFVGIAFDSVGRLGAADASPPTVDPYGYASVSALSNATLTAGASGSPLGPASSASATGVSVVAGAIVTVVVVGTETPSTTEAGVPAAQLLECIDNAGTVGSAGSCSVISM
jgi:hypothetical protein